MDLRNLKTKSYRFGMTWGWVNDDGIDISQWIMSLKHTLVPPQTLDQVYSELTSMASLSKILSWRKSSSLIFLSWKSSSIWAWASSSCCRTLSMWLMELLWGVLLLEMAESLQERQCKSRYSKCKFVLVCARDTGRNTFTSFNNVLWESQSCNKC